MEHWKRVTREVVESPTSEILKSQTVEAIWKSLVSEGWQVETALAINKWDNCFSRWQDQEY